MISVEEKLLELKCKMLPSLKNHPTTTCGHHTKVHSTQATVPTHPQSHSATPATPAPKDDYLLRAPR